MIAHGLQSECMSPMIMHDLKSECTSPTIVYSNQTTYQTIANAHNNSIAWGKQSYHDLVEI